MQADEIESIESTKPVEPFSGVIERDGNICRDFLRNVCQRGELCRYTHPRNLIPLGQQYDLTFCHDFQNGACRRPNCKFVHCTKTEEEEYRNSGVLPSVTDIGKQPSNVPVCKDFLNHNCHRGAQCKFRHGRPQPGQVTSERIQSRAQNNQPHSGLPMQPASIPVYHPIPISQHVIQKPQTYAENLVAEYAPPHTSAVATTPETTAMVAAAAAASYLAIHKQQQQHQVMQGHEQMAHLEPQLSQKHHHQTAAAGALPPASAAAAFAAAAAATAFATTARHHQQQLHTSEALSNNPQQPTLTMFPETPIPVAQSASIPVMQSMMEAVTLQSMVSTSPTYPVVVNSLTNMATSATDAICHEGAHSFYQTGAQHPTASNPNHGRPPLRSGPVSSTNFLISEAASTTVSSANFEQHQHDANTAAAVAAAACLGAMFSQPVAAAAAANATSSTQVSVAAQQVTPSQNHHPAPPLQTSVHSLPPPPPASAVAAAAAAAVAAAVVSSASRPPLSTSMVAHSTHLHHHHPPSLATVTTTCSFIASSAAAAVDSAKSAVARLPHTSMLSGMSGRAIVSTDPYADHFPRTPSVVDSDVAQRSLISVPHPVAVTVPSPAAASVAYTATMTTAAAAAAMAAAAVAVEEHNQKKQNAAAAAAMAAFKGNACLHGVSTEPFGSPTEAALDGGGRIFINQEMVGSTTGARLQPCHRRRQSHFADVPSFDVDDDIGIGYFEDEDDDMVESVDLIAIAENVRIEDMSQTKAKKDIGCLDSDKVEQSITLRGSPDNSFGRSLPLIKQRRQRSLSFPPCANRVSPDNETLRTTTRTRLASSPPASSRDTSRNQNPCGVTPSFSKVGIGGPAKRAKLMESVTRGNNRPTTKVPRRRFQESHRIYPHSTRMKHFDIESVLDVEDEDEYCLTNAPDFYSPTHVVAPLYRESIYALKQENARLRLSLQRVLQQKSSLHAENSALLRQNLKLRKLNIFGKRMNTNSMGIEMFPSRNPSALESGTFITAPKAGARKRYISPASSRSLRPPSDHSFPATNTPESIP